MEVAALEFGRGSEVTAQGREEGAGLLFGQVGQVGSVEDDGDGFEDFGIKASVALAGFGYTCGLESGFFCAVGPVVGYGAFFPAPFFGPLAGSTGEFAVAAARPNAIGSCGCARRAQPEVDFEAVVPIGRFIRLLVPSFGGGFICHFFSIAHMNGVFGQWRKSQVGSSRCMSGKSGRKIFS